MSRVGGVAIELNDVSAIVCQEIRIVGPLGQLVTRNHPALAVSLEGSVLLVRTRRPDRRSSAIQGTVRALIRNSVCGVTAGFKRTLILAGVGFRAATEGGSVLFHLGYTNVIRFAVPRGIKVTTKSPAEVIVFGSDKQLVGQVCSEIRRLRSVEPYKGKGIRYDNEVVKTKEKKKDK